MRVWDGKYGPLLIAEIGGNHEGDFAYAMKLTDLALESDADVVKFQVYTGDSLVSRVEGSDRNRHFKKFELLPEQYIELAQKVERNGKIFMASVWAIDMIEFLDEYMPIYKIGSGDLTAYPLLREFAKRGKPIIMSTGLASAEEVCMAVDTIREANPVYEGSEYLALLQCTSMYPIPATDANLSVMQTLKQCTGATIGYSDHTEGVRALEIAYAMGAEVLEFHFTDNREGKVFRDHKVSLTANEVRDLQHKLLEIRKLRGSNVKKALPVEADHVISFRRAVYPARDLPAGKIITDADLVVLRPNHGIDARDYEEVLGKQLVCSVKKHQKLMWEMLR